MTDNTLLQDLKQDVTNLSNILYDIVTYSKENIWPDNEDYYKIVSLLEDIRNHYND